MNGAESPGGPASPAIADDADRALSRISVFVSAPPELGERGWGGGKLAFLDRGFRPFFLAAGLWAIVSVAIVAPLPWLDRSGMLASGDAVRHAYGSVFGYGGALLAGFLLTAVPNWTGRRPLARLPLLGVFFLWLFGRMSLVTTGATVSFLAAAADVAFLSLLVFFTARDVVASGNWRNLKTVGLLSLFALANTWFLAVEYTGHTAQPAARLGLAALLGLVMLIGGRIAPHFTREWLVARDGGRLPSPYDRYDDAALFVAAAALAAWTVMPGEPATAVLLATAGLAHAVRLARWVGHTVWRQPILLILHVGYGFVPLGFLLLALAAAAPGLIEQTAAIHAWTTGAIGVTALGIMTRATRSHTGCRVVASSLTSLAYAAVVAAALLRVVDGGRIQWPGLVAAAAVLWIVAHTAFLIEYAPLLVGGRAQRR